MKRFERILCIANFVRFSVDEFYSFTPVIELLVKEKVKLVDISGFVIVHLVQKNGMPVTCKLLRGSTFV